MPAADIDLDLLATHIQSKMSTEKLSLRTVGDQIGCSAATVSRLLLGSKTPNYPDSQNLIRAASWVGRSLTDFERGRRDRKTSFADVEVHLRALPGLTREDKEALVAMVKAAHDAAYQFRKKKS